MTIAIFIAIIFAAFVIGYEVKETRTAMNAHAETVIALLQRIERKTQYIEQNTQNPADWRERYERLGEE